MQPKHRIGEPDDEYEKEADRIAEQVIRMPDSETAAAADDPAQVENSGSAGGSIRRKPLADTITPLVQRKRDDEDEETLQTRPAGDTSVISSDVAAAIHCLKSRGQPLSESSRNYFEPRFGHDFSRIRIHADSRAANLAGSIRARAFTLGNHIVFGAGRYTPESESGRRLMAHELTHTVQQQGDTMLQASPVDSDFGQFNDIFYDVLTKHRNDVSAGTRYSPLLDNEYVPVGVQMYMSFTPGRLVNASSIGLVQIARTINRGDVSVLNNVPRNRVIPEGEAGPIDSSIASTDEGFHVDRIDRQHNPLYAVNEDDRDDTHSTLTEGRTPDPVVPFTGVSVDRIHGGRYTGYGGHGSREGPDDTPHEATMQDRPTSRPDPETEQLLETAALAIEGEQTGMYYGSVQWGWRIDRQGRFSKLPMTLKSRGTPSATFYRAARRWNTGEDSEEVPNIPLPTSEISVVTNDYVAFYGNPQDLVLGIPPLGYLLRGTRVERLDNTGEGLEMHVRVVQCDRFRGFIDTFDDSTVLSGQVRFDQPTPIYRHSQDIALGIAPYLTLPAGQGLRIVDSDQFETQVAADSCRFIGQSGYIDTLSPGRESSSPLRSLYPFLRRPLEPAPSPGEQQSRRTQQQPGSLEAESQAKSGSRTRSATGHAPQATTVQSQLGPDDFAPEHVIQGGLNDCYLLAALLSLTTISRGRSSLANTVRQRSDGNFSVTLFVRPVADGPFEARTIDIDLNADPGRGSIRSRPWVRAVEYAYAELYGSWDEMSGDLGGTEIGGAQRALEHLTGEEAFRQVWLNTADPDDLWSRITSALDSQLPVTTGTSARADSGPGNAALSIVGPHNYAITGYSVQAGNRRLTLRNPWGAGAGDNAEITIGYDRFRQYFVYLAIGYHAHESGLDSRISACVYPRPDSPTASGTVQPKLDAATPAQSATNADAALTAPSFGSGLQSLRGAGRRLSGAERAFFEPRFGADFSNVRIHQDPTAAALARDINARAFTLRNDIVLGAGQYNPSSSRGKRLLGHELTHVIQQRQGFQGSLLQRQTNLTAEEQRASDPDVQGFFGPFASLITGFVSQLGSAADFNQANTVVTTNGNSLWQNATQRSQLATPSSLDDRPLYWTRLRMIREIRQFQGAFTPTSQQRNNLVAAFEAASRGRSSARFSASANSPNHKRILISGFDPFGLDRVRQQRRGITDSNPSGAVAINLDGDTINNGNIDAEVQAVIFPVRFRDFDQGVVENFFRPYLTGTNQPHLIFTISQGTWDYDIEQRAGNARSRSLPDNEGGLSQRDLVDPGGPDSIATNLNFTPAGTRLNQNPGPYSTTPAQITGTGGTYLSNEIYYRVRRLQGTSSSIPMAHLHLPIDSGDMNARSNSPSTQTIVQNVRNILIGMLPNI